MAQIPLLPGQAGGLATGSQNVGIPVVGSAGRNQLSPVIAGPVPTLGVPGSITGMPVSTMPPSQGGKGLPTTLHMKKQAMDATGNQQPTVANVPGTGQVNQQTATGVSQNGTVNNGMTPQQQKQLQKQLIDTYGKGEGSLLMNLLNDLGSNDSSYMQAYQQAMAKPTQEGLNTLETSEGNAGISANSSVAAISKADYMSSMESQMGLQEQQLLQQQMQDRIAITQGMQEKMSQEASSSPFLNFLGQGIGAASGILGSLGDAGLL